MSQIEPYTLTARKIATAVQSGDLRMQDVAAFYLDRTDRFACELNTHLYWSKDVVAQQVRFQEERLGRGEKLPLAGVPVLLKDNICAKDMPTTCASRILADFRPVYDASVVARLRAAGAIIFGKANCDEFAMGSSGENSAFGPTQNPWDRTRVPGGSSSGSAAAVAADLVPVALGSDTGGSVRQPAAFCGVVGLKPTYGLVSRFGLVAYGSSLDQIGPITRTVDDAALLLDVISGHDPQDSTSLAVSPTQTAASLTASKPLAGLKLGLVRELWADGLDQGTRAAVEQAVKIYTTLGATVREIGLPSLQYSISAYYVLATAEASSNLARYDGVRYGYRHEKPGQSLKEMYRRTRSEGFGREVKQRIMLGTYALSAGYYDAYYAKANRARAMITRDFDRAFTQVDLLIAPTAPTTAYKIGEKTRDPLAMYLGDIGTLGANLAGIPAVSIPCGFDAQGMPVGLQLMGPRLSEDKLMKGAQLYEQACHWHRRPQLG